MRFVIDLDLDGDERVLLRLLRALLKRLGRDHGVRCKGIVIGNGERAISSS